MDARSTATHRWGLDLLAKKRGQVIVAGLVVAALHVGLVLDGARRHTPAFDEPNYLTRGYVSLTTGDQSKNPEHPPTMMLLLGASILGTGIDAKAVPGFADLDGFHFGQRFLYQDGVSAMGLLWRARAVVAMLSVLACFAIFLLARRLGGDLAGLAALAIYALDPLVIAHAGLATLDLGTATLMLLSAACLPWAIQRGGPRPALAGALLALALTSKFSSLPLVLGLLATGGLALWRPVGCSRPRLLLRLSLLLAVGALTIAAVCMPHGPGILWTALRLQFTHATGGHPAFAFGRYSMHGWWWYYPAAWLVKTPVPILLLTALGLPALVACRRRALLLLTSLAVPAAGLGGGSVFSATAIGVRHLLPLVPVLAIGGGIAAAGLWVRRGSARLLLPILAAWLLFDAVASHPDQLSFINEPAGGSKAGFKRLTDSNIDWGTDLAEVARIVHRQPLRRLYLAYFGSALPASHGLPAYRWLPTMNLAPRLQEDGTDPQGREWIAISATALTGAYAQGKDTYAWLRDRVPTAWAGGSILLFDITGDAQAHLALARSQLAARYSTGARAALERAQEIDPTVAL